MSKRKRCCELAPRSIGGDLLIGGVEPAEHIEHDQKRNRQGQRELGAHAGKPLARPDADETEAERDAEADKGAGHDEAADRGVKDEIGARKPAVIGHAGGGGFSQ